MFSNSKNGELKALKLQFEKQGLEKCLIRWSRRINQAMSCVLFYFIVQSV